jgi:hypothetical protein
MLADQSGQLEPVGAGHRHVGEQQRHVGLEQDAKRFLHRTGLDEGLAKLGEDDLVGEKL